MKHIGIAELLEINIKRICDEEGAQNIINFRNSDSRKNFPWQYK